jgi:CHASE1-domain containing sensor protein
LTFGKEYIANLRVYTSKNVEDVDNEFTDFFEALDIDQGIEDFIKAYWVYPSKIRFELEEVEEP